MPIELALKKSKAWMNAYAPFLENLSVANTERTRIAYTLHKLSIEHGHAIHALIQGNLVGSAFALLRPQFEGVIRGLWFFNCATNNDIAKFLKGEEPPKINDLISNIEKLDCFKSGYLSATKGNAWKTLNDFTHGGKNQVFAGNTETEIVQNNNPLDIAKVILHSSSVTLIALDGIGNVLGDTGLSNKFSLLYKTIYQD